MLSQAHLPLSPVHLIFTIQLSIFFLTLNNMSFDVFCILVCVVLSVFFLFIFVLFWVGFIKKPHFQG